MDIVPEIWIVSRAGMGKRLVRQPRLVHRHGGLRQPRCFILEVLDVGVGFAHICSEEDKNFDDL